MSDTSSKWNRINTWIRIPILVGVVAVAVWQSLQFLPLLIEKTAKGKLLREGIVASEFPVEGVGLKGISVGPGTLLMDSNTLHWESLHVRYLLRDVMDGRVDHVYLNRPVINFYLPEPGPVTPLSPPPVPAETPGEAAPVAPVLPGKPPPAPVVAPARPAERPTLREQLTGLPLNELTASNGRVEFLLDEAALVGMDLEARLENQPFGTSGELVLENEWLAAEISLRVPAHEDVVTLQADAVLPPGALRTIESTLRGAYHPSELLPQVVSSGSFSLDLLFEIPGQGLPIGSGEASVEELALRFPFMESDLVFNNFLVAGTYRDGLLSLQGGMEILPFQYGAFNGDGFSMRFSQRPDGLLDLETEAFTWRVGQASGEGALRGEASLFTPDNTFSGRLEASLTRFEWGGLQVDPFSILVTSDGRTLQLEGSEMGVVHTGTIWVEEFQAELDPSGTTGTSSFSWFNLAGQPMGGVRAEFEQPSDANASVRLDFSGPQGETFLTARYDKSGDTTRLEGRGLLRLDWINSLNKWWKTIPLSLSGKGPRFEMDLSGYFPFLHGSARIFIDGLGMQLDSGVRLSGIQGDVDLLVSTLPRSSGPQLLEIQSVETGEIRLADVDVKWEMPHLRALRILDIQGSLEKGSISVDPFQFDPMNPDFQTVIHFSGIPGNLLLELLGESRFTIQGNVSGQLAFAWKEDTLVIGKASLTMDESGGKNRFIFSDPAFLKEKFASFGGVPAELKERFLEALLKDGIKIETLEATLGSTQGNEQILLRIALSGESRTDRLQVPIKGFVINNLISPDDLVQLLGLFGTLNIRTAP